MIIRFDTDIQWQNVAGDLDPANATHHYAAPAPYLLLLTLEPAVLDGIGHMTMNLPGHTFECDHGVHDVGEPAGYTLPQYHGYPHHKITVKAFVSDVPAGDVFDLSYLLRRAPVEYKLWLPPVEGQGLEVLELKLPHPLIAALSAMATKHKTNPNVICWQALLNYVNDYY